MRSFFRRKSTYLIGIPVVLLLAAGVIYGGTYFYIHVIEGPAPKKLGFSHVTSTTSRGSTTSSDSGSNDPSAVDGTWNVTNGSQVGYRVGEILFGQSATAVGRTSSVTGNLTITGKSAASGSFTADLTTVHSDQGNRDRQFQGRIMDTSSFPTATFKLSSPIALASIPANLAEITVSASGDLTLHGKTREVTFPLKARRNGADIEVNGLIPIKFADYGIPNPTFGPATTQDNGQLEFLLVFARV